MKPPRASDLIAALHRAQTATHRAHDLAARLRQPAITARARRAAAALATAAALASDLPLPTNQ